jgi:glycosyltransferase involved in cell wall biosynthesis
MRILLIANTLPPTDLSGVGEQVVQLAAGLRARGHEVELLGRRPEGLGSRKVLFPLTVLPAAARVVMRWRPHVVQVHESDCALAALWVRLLGALLDPQPRLLALLQVSYVEELRAVRPSVWEGRVLGRPTAVEKRFRWFKAPAQIVLGTLTAWLADVVVAPSRQTASELERDYRVEDVHVLPNVTGGLERRNDPSVAERVPRDALLFVGRLRIRKGVEVLLEALSMLGKRGLRPRLVVAGDGEHRGVLEGRVTSLGLADQVTFVGRCTPGQVRGLLAVARALVVPSTYEGMPLVILEAMDAGVAVVASAVSGMPEVVVEGETGWLVPPVDPPALADALEAVSTGGEAARRGAAGRERVEESFRPGDAAVAWEEIVASGE